MKAEVDYAKEPDIVIQEQDQDLIVIKKIGESVKKASEEPEKEQVKQAQIEQQKKTQQSK